VYLTLAEVLALPVLQAGAPRVRSGSAHLDVPERWVHVSELRDPAGTLGGGELLLSIGMNLADATVDHAAYVAALRDAGAVGLVVELGQHVTALPAALLQAARAVDFPVVELGRHVRFVEITEVVHARILHNQYARMRFTQQVHDTFRALSGESGEPVRVLTEVASLVRSPVVLEDLGHRALWSAGDLPPELLLRDWTARSRQVPLATSTTSGGPEGWTVTPVGPRTRPWGRLVVPRRIEIDSQDEVRIVLEHAADALTIRRLLADDPVPPELAAQSALLQDLLRSTGVDERSLRTRARALGLPPAGVLTAVAATAAPGELVEAAADAARRARTPAVVGRLATGRVALVVWSRSPDHEANTVERLARQLEAAVVGAAGPVTSYVELSAALAEAAFVLDVATTLPASDRRAWRATDLWIDGLLWRLRGDPRLTSHADSELGPLLRLDEPGRGVMLDTLLAYLDAGGAVTAFARAVGLSRPAAYARLDRLRETLKRDLDDPRTRLSLHIALLSLHRPKGETRDAKGAHPRGSPSVR
jgi:purine catabolism regulator